MVIAALDKARPSLPIKPLPKKEPSDDNIQKSGAKGGKVAKVVKSVMKSGILIYNLIIKLINLFKFEYITHYFYLFNFFF